MPKKYYLDPDEIFLDSSNLPSLDNQQFEGRLERPISKSTFYFLALFFSLIGFIFIGRTAELQLLKGASFAERSANNTLRHLPLFSERGVIYDSREVELAWNNPSREYTREPGFASLLGYISYPTEADLRSADFNTRELIGKDGVERRFDAKLKGQVGIQIEEVDVLGKVQTSYLLKESLSGEEVRLSIDARLQAKLAELIAQVAAERGFTGGAGVLIDVQTGELLSLVSQPEYDANILTAGTDAAAIKALLTSPDNPFLNRALFGLYTPGSIIKPIIALGALSEKVISPEKQILSTGALTVPNPFFPGQDSVFRDWKAHGLVDLRRALAISSNVYFYEIGGGFGDQPGLGIKRIEDYARKFGLGQTVMLDGEPTAAGLVPNPEWKAANFSGEDWRLGDTYHTAIGQYGFQVTPLQMARAIAAIATNGRLVSPTLLLSPSESSLSTIALSPADFQIVREGMRLSVTEGTAAALNVPFVPVAAKTGTAELGTTKSEVNSWVVGFFPYEAPRYAFAVVMERGREDNLIGAAFVMRSFFDWLNQTAPEYLR